MKKTVNLIDWNYNGDKVDLHYSDDTSLQIKKSDFDRAMGCILPLPKELVIRDFAGVSI